MHLQPQPWMEKQYSVIYEERDTVHNLTKHSVNANQFLHKQMLSMQQAYTLCKTLVVLRKVVKCSIYYADFLAKGLSALGMNSTRPQHWSDYKPGCCHWDACIRLIYHIKHLTQFKMSNQIKF